MAGSRMNRLVAACALLLGGLAPCDPALAARVVQGPGGLVYQVYEFGVSEGLEPFFSRSLDPHREQTTILLERTDPRTGAVEYLVPPGVQPYSSDGSAGIAVDPLSGEVLLLWSHDAGGDSEILIARFDGVRWAGPFPVTADDRDNRDPCFVIDLLGRVHLVWWEEGGQSGIHYARFDPYAVPSSGGVEAFRINPGESLLVGGDPASPDEGGDSRFPFLSYDARTDLVYLAFSHPLTHTILVLWFGSEKGDGTEWGGGEAFVPVRLSLNVSGDEQKAGAAARPMLLAFRGLVVLYWSEGPGFVGFVTIQPGSSAVPEVRTRQVPADASLTQIERILLDELTRSSSGTAGDPSGQSSRGYGARR